MRSGAPINVTCLISSSPAPPAFVFWYHNARMINYDYGSPGGLGGEGTRGQISVAKDPNRADVVISRLLIRAARLDDSGNYTCSPSNAEPASSYVHVLQGKKIFYFFKFRFNDKANNTKFSLKILKTLQL